ncbi:MAG: MiaB/RimO family radical SAM methylthiotransferase [Gammaproteobacteria bacterium]|nr:MiaB/RimO family radical SAM methylthiotransferase [Gammaproteobacteria bacterium]MCW8841488.1 MiaB/RimO family radical SAM methylthiotransferase [Gammaproteobacteria bacterium]MCW8928025.1 MiaB/RimO family radical SAM methylthiotransferase [Gammaproteobacteria bacterium]MCW8959461.1 MiaB/RimO family radical SAM methylthiotransferase [Gammaproteobacteria bacterium]MCW8972486.1 MiaB/RimO family radical SAM methylthiotransferase [Gammaproteobacteria bacterium]
MKFYIRTLGCKMNWLDSARLAAALQTAGNTAVADEAEADYVFVNTCTVTAEADRKSKQIVNRAGRQQKQVAVMGCGPRVERNEWQQQSANALVFSDEQQMLAHFGIENDELLLPLNSRTRLPVAIQTGCDNLCTFCITRVARGQHRSLPAEQIVRQIELALENDIREVVLTGINLAAWGCENSNHPEQARLHELLEIILQRTAIPRIRISSIGPQFIQPAFFDVYRDERICDYLHISLQSGSDSVLQRMVRGHGTEEVARIAERARAVRPDTALSADIIAGFPGESEAEHRQTLAFLEQVGFAKLHVFPYSIREGTLAADIAGQLPQELKKARAGEVRELARILRKRFIAEQFGKRFQVLVEGNGSGLSGNYLRLLSGDHTQGEIVEVVVNEESLAESY